jgi:hypothetical protein
MAGPARQRGATAIEALRHPLATHPNQRKDDPMAKLHRSSRGDGNLIARARAAEAIRADFERELRSSEPDVIDWRDWGRRLSSVLGECLDLLLGGPGANVTVVFEDQSAFLSSTDVGICRAALRTAAGTAPGDPFSVLYRSLARRLGAS